jgi:ankyrin repeat protein
MRYSRSCRPAWRSSPDFAPWTGPSRGRGGQQILKAQEVIDAVKLGDTNRVRELLDQNPALANARTATGESAALMAAYHRRSEIATLLISHGAQLSFFEAAALGQTDLVRDWLVREPELLDACSPDGFTALALASHFGHSGVVLDLLTRNAEVNAVANNAMRVMPLHAAVAGGHHSIAKALLTHGARVNAPQQMGWRPLHAAAQLGDVAMIRLLLDHGADPEAKNDHGLTSLDVAQERGHIEAVRLLSGV